MKVKKESGREPKETVTNSPALVADEPCLSHRVSHTREGSLGEKSSALKAKEIIKQLMKDGSIWEEIIQKALDDASRYTIDIDYSKYISKKKVLEIIDSIKNWDRNCPLKKELVEKIKEELNATTI